MKQYIISSILITVLYITFVLISGACIGIIVMAHNYMGMFVSATILGSIAFSIFLSNLWRQ